MAHEYVKGLPVITMAEGKQIGKVDDLIVDPERKAVSWLRLHSGGMLGVSGRADRGGMAGEDAVTINAADAAPPTRRTPWPWSKPSAGSLIQ
jgi:sporulation protein YlmC with PRC-barrel domain